VVRSHTGCTTDDDCTVVSPPFACWQGCPEAIYRPLQAQFDEDLALVMQQECANRPQRCDPEPSGGCIELRAACYSAGTCTTVCNQPGWPDPKAPGGFPSDLQGQFVRERGYCGDTSCPALPEPIDPRGRYALSCCTEEGACGVFAWPLGPDCFEHQQVGMQNQQCPSITLSLFIDEGNGFGVNDSFPGCCRSDGLCGVDTSRTWGAGCVTRSAISHAAARTCNEDNFHLATLEDIACDYNEPAD
jgi:hypothetical protein